MKNKIAVTTLLCLAVIGFKEMEIRPLDELPRSEPTPVELFMKRISDIESGGNHKVVNQYGMMGKYQFGMSAIRAVGLRVSREEFLRNPELQDTAMVRLMKLHDEELKHLIARYEGKTIKGVKITRATVLAGAHFAGAGGVRAFLTNGDHYGTIDGNGTSLRYYMSKFKDFHLPIISL
jgi:hypothetical protein